MIAGEILEILIYKRVLLAKEAAKAKAEKEKIRKAEEKRKKLEEGKDLRLENLSKVTPQAAKTQNETQARAN